MFKCSPKIFISVFFSAGLAACKRTLSSSTLELQEGGRGGISGRQRLRVPYSSLSYSLDKGLDQIDLSRPQPVPRLQSITHNSGQPLDAAASSEDDGQKEFLNTWAARGPAPNYSDIEVDSEKSLYSGNDTVQNSPLPEESLASIINKMNSPAAVSTPKTKVNLKSAELSNNDVNDKFDSSNSFLQPSIRQVTVRQTFLDS